jgi:ATP-binding cassette subfamily F protein 3
MMTAGALSYSYDPGIPLIQGLDLSVRAGDRICVVGPNGQGKTTLLKLLAETLKPQVGAISFNPGVIKGVFEQTNIAELNLSRTAEEEILYSHEDVDRQLSRNICGAMMFEGDDALKKISVLSGGEKSRVMLGKLLATPVNLLLLDEPTNHLDMYSCDALLAAIDSFEGAVVMVTHNEMFLHALAERLVVFHLGKVSIFEGSYQDFLDKGGWGDDENSRHRFQGGETRKIQHSGGLRVNKKALRKRRSEIVSQRSRVLGPLEKRIVQVETEIDTREKELAELGLAMEQAVQDNDGKKIAHLSQSVSICQPLIDTLFDELEKLTDDLEEKKELYERRLKELES